MKKVPVGDNAEWLTKMLREVHVMEALRHPNIIAYKHTWLEINKLSTFAPHVPCLFILMEYANGGNLEDYICAEVMDESDKELSASSQALPIGDILWLFSGICRGLEHLHHSGIIHRDLKPSNILLHYPAGQVTRPQVLISDFGECNTQQSAVEVVRTGATGTIEFCAPELFLVDRRGKYLNQHSQKTDIWSLGMILYFMLFGGTLPYPDIDDVAILRRDMLNLEKVSFPQFRSDVPHEILDLLKILLSLDPSERPGIIKVVKTVDTAIAALSRSSSHLSKPIFNVPTLQSAEEPAFDAKQLSGLFSAEIIVSLIIIVSAAHCYPNALHWSIFVFLCGAFVLRRFGTAVMYIMLFGLLLYLLRILLAKSICSC